jgi:hypothetical protein
MMTRHTLSLLLASCVAAVVVDRPVLAHGFGGGGGFRGGGGFSGGGFRGGFAGGGFAGGGFAGGGFRGAPMGGMHYGGEMGGMRSGGMDAYRGGYGGMSSFGRTPSFSSPGTFSREGGEFRGYNPYAGGGGVAGRSYTQGAYGGRAESGYRAGSYTTERGTTIDYGAAGRAGVGPAGGEAARGVAGVNVTTPGGRSFTDVGRAGGAVGPGGAAIGGRSNLAVASGPRGTAVAGSRGGFAAGPGGAVAGERGFGATGFRPNGFNAYGAYHDGWVHGYWNGHGDTAWGWHNGYWGGWGYGGWGWGLGMGMGLGFGLAAWGFGSSLYGWGYMPYTNPYYGYGGGTTVVAVPYDYSQPIDTTGAVAAQSVVDPAMVTFDAARASFKAGNYQQALAQTDDALKSLPNDTALHEFRALCLFALNRYDEAAATLYAVLSVGPGWDWATLVGLYPSVDVYTAQLRALEDYCTAHLNSAPARFVLAYHYLTEGHTEAAATMFQQVVALMPSDTLSAKLARQLTPPTEQPPASGTAATGAPASAPEPDQTDTIVPQGATIAGTWKAQPTADTSIELTIQPGGSFTWQVRIKGRTQQFNGSSTFGDGLLTLVQDKGPILVGRISWKDASHMTFRVVGDGPEDPGLSFSK